MIRVSYLRLPNGQDGRNFTWNTKNNSKRKLDTNGMPPKSYPDFYATVGRLEGLLFLLVSTPSACEIAISISHGVADVSGSLELASRYDEGPVSGTLREIEEVANQLAYGFTGEYAVTIGFWQKAFIRRPDGELTPIQ